MKFSRFIILILIMGLVVSGCSQQEDLTAPDKAIQVAGHDKNGTEALGPPVGLDIATGSGIAQGGVGMVDTDTGQLDLTVPEGATINQVLLYWAGGTTSDNGDDTISVDTNPVTGDLIGGPTLFFGNYTFYAYRADVTDQDWVVAGANSFTITDFDFDFSAGTLDENNGVSMLVIYDDGTEAEISLVDGLDLAFFEFAPTLDATVAQTFTFAPEAGARTADLVVFAGSVGVNRPNEITVTTSAGVQSFPNELGSTDGLLWDSLTLSVDVPAGVSEMTIQLISTPSTSPLGASMAWVGSALSVPVSPLYCIGDFVWFDENGNGCQDEGEEGVAGVEVNLWTGCEPESIIATVTTGLAGEYEFCGLEPGDYTVQFVSPNGYIFCEKNAAGCDPATDSNPDPATGITDCVTIVDQDDMTIDAGLCLPPTYCIGDFVWFDENGNGCQDEGEEGVDGVEVKLWVGCPPSEVIKSTVTANGGYYEFCDLQPREYTVQFLAPDGYIFCEKNAAGCDPATDSNPDPATGITDCVTIVDQDDMTIDAGLCMPPMDGCTLTIGFWKGRTGLGNGNQEDLVTQYLPIWLGDDTGAKSLGVTTVEMALDVLEMKTYGRNNNGITKLYGQLLGAKLSIATGASDSAVAAEIDDADAFLADYDWMDWDSLSDADRDMVMMWQGMFDDYNNGYIGPGHCDDDNDDDTLRTDGSIRMQ